MATLSKHRYLQWKSHVLAHQFHQLFIKLMIDFSAAFHIVFEHHFSVFASIMELKMAQKVT